MPQNPAFRTNVEPTQDPDYENRSKGIEAPKFVSTIGEAFKDLGTLFSGAVKGVDEIVGAYATEKATEAAAPEREREQLRLAAIKKSLTGGAPVTSEQPGLSREYVPTTEELMRERYTDTSIASAESGGYGVLVDKTDPQALQTLPGRVSTLQGARANGRLSETDFNARMDALASDLRGRFPGYKDKIDAVFSHYTGGDPANKYITSVLGDINSYLTNEQTERNHVMSQIRELANKGHPDAEKLAAFVRFGGDLTRAQGLISEANRLTYTATVAKDRMEIVKNNDALLSDATEKLASIHLATISTSYETALDKLRPEGVATDEKGNLILDDAKAEMMAREAGRQRGLSENQMLRWFNDPKNGTAGRSPYQILGATKANEMIKANLAMFDFAIGNITNKETGLTTAAARLIRAVKENNELVAFRDFPILQKLDVIRNTVGHEAMSYVLQNLLQGGDTLSQLKAFANVNWMNVLAPTDKNNPTSLAAIMDEAKRVGIALPALSNDLLSKTDRLVAPGVDDREKYQIALAIANPDNRRLITGFGPDTTDSRGRVIPGSETLFRKFTSDAYVGEIKRLSAKDPKLMKDYRDFVELSNRALFIRDMKDLDARIGNLPAGSKIRWSDDNQLHYDLPGMPDYNLRAPRAGSAGTFSSGRMTSDAVSRTINRVNEGLSAVARVAKEDPTLNVKEHLLHVLMSDVSLNESVEGLPAKILEELKAQAPRNREIVITRERALRRPRPAGARE